MFSRGEGTNGSDESIAHCLQTTRFYARPRYQLKYIQILRDTICSLAPKMLSSAGRGELSTFPGASCSFCHLTAFGRYCGSGAEFHGGELCTKARVAKAER